MDVCNPPQGEFMGMEEDAGQFLGALPPLMHEPLVVPHSVLLPPHFLFLDCPHQMGIGGFSAAFPAIFYLSITN